MKHPQDMTPEELIRLPDVTRLRSEVVFEFEADQRVWEVGWNGTWVKRYRWPVK